MSKRKVILDSALTLFVSQGISETSTASIAKHANVATGTLFHHFENKKKLVESLYLSLKQQMVADVALDLPIENPVQTFELWRKVIDWGLKNEIQFSFFSIYYSSPWVDESYKKSILNSVFSFLFEYIELQKNNNFFIDLPTDFLVMQIQQTIINTVNYIANRRDTLSEMQIRDITKASFTACMLGIEKRCE